MGKRVSESNSGCFCLIFGSIPNTTTTSFPLFFLSVLQLFLFQVFVVTQLPTRGCLGSRWILPNLTSPIFQGRGRWQTWLPGGMWICQKLLGTLKSTDFMTCRCTGFHSFLGTPWLVPSPISIDSTAKLYTTGGIGGLESNMFKVIPKWWCLFAGFTALSLYPSLPTVFAEADNEFPLIHLRKKQFYVQHFFFFLSLCLSHIYIYVCTYINIWQYIYICIHVYNYIYIY